MALDYTEKLLEHFQNPRNVGSIENADGLGKVGNLLCGDILWVYIKVEEDKITDIKYKTFGCAAAIASGSLMTELVKGRTIEELLKKGKTPEDAIAGLKKEIIEGFGGMPQQKIHCSLLASDALYEAVKDYQLRKKEEK